MVSALCLDVVGTLIHVHGSVGLHYARVAQRWGMHRHADLLEKRFYQVLRQQPPVVFTAGADWDKSEELWWREVVWLTVNGGQFSDFDGYFAEVYQHFAQGTTWQVYPEVFDTLESLKKASIPLVVISNFDRRVLSVLAQLKLTDYFDHIVYSSLVGSAKPDAKIFTYAQSLLPDTKIFHVGDSFGEDFLGATAAGLTAIWLNRLGSSEHSHIRSLTELNLS